VVFGEYLAEASNLEKQQEFTLCIEAGKTEKQNF
jgi:hypothetical protein